MQPPGLLLTSVPPASGTATLRARRALPLPQASGQRKGQATRREGRLRRPRSHGAGRGLRAAASARPKGRSPAAAARALAPVVFHPFTLARRCRVPAARQPPARPPLPARLPPRRVPGAARLSGQRGGPGLAFATGNQRSAFGTRPREGEMPWEVPPIG